MISRPQITILFGIIIISSIIIFTTSEKKDTPFTRETHNLLPVHTTETYALSSNQQIKLQATPVAGSLNNNLIRLYSFNTQIPGPLLKVTQGDTITVDFTNNLDQETTVHWHGLRLENKNDGVPHLTQDPVRPGETFQYTLTFPDPGVYWYHPHVREDYQQELGLYGNIFVTPKQRDYFNPVDHEAFLFIDDILLEHGDIFPYSAERITQTLMGRFGNTYLINGQPNYTFPATQGDIIRFYLTNAANTRIFNLSIPSTPLKLVGSDGGSYEYERFVDSLIIAPSERYIIEFSFETPGTYMFTHTTPFGTTPLGTIIISENISPSSPTDFTILHENRYVQEDINAYRAYFDKPIDAEFRLSVDVTGMMQHMNTMPCHQMPDGSWMGDCGEKETTTRLQHVENIEWEDTMPMMNLPSTDETVKWLIIDARTGKQNMDIQSSWKKGDKVKIRLFNDPQSAHPMQHPIHFHGQRFLVLAENGVQNTNLVWKDTVLVPVGTTVDILLDASNPGTWMAHCHIAEHLHSGMMTTFTVT